MIRCAILKRLLVVSMLLLPIVAIVNANAETCPNFDQMTFKTLAEYNKYKSTVHACYIMPDMAAKKVQFPIVFHPTKTVEISSDTPMAKKAPFVGNKVICQISWEDKNHVVTSTNVIINEKVKTTSADWHSAGADMISCDDKNSAKNCCTFAYSKK